MDELFDEIKNKHETHNFKSQIGPAPRGPIEEKGSFDNGDPTTTNLFVGNLNPLTTGTHGYSLMQYVARSDHRVVCRGALEPYIRALRIHPLGQDHVAQKRRRESSR